jgi:hypothetical protein
VHLQTTRYIYLLLSERVDETFVQRSKETSTTGHPTTCHLAPTRGDGLQPEAHGECSRNHKTGGGPVESLTGIGQFAPKPERPGNPVRDSIDRQIGQLDSLVSTAPRSNPCSLLRRSCFTTHKILRRHCSRNLLKKGYTARNCSGDRILLRTEMGLQGVDQVLAYISHHSFAPWISL